SARSSRAIDEGKAHPLRAAPPDLAFEDLAGLLDQQEDAPGNEIVVGAAHPCSAFRQVGDDTSQVASTVHRQQPALQPDLYAWMSALVLDHGTADHSIDSFGDEDRTEC